PDQVGPVRSARASDLELLKQYGRPAFAYSGARATVLKKVREAPLYDVSPARAGDGYTRRGPHSTPHNLYARPERLLRHAEGAEPPPDVGFRYGEAPTGGERRTAAACGTRRSASDSAGRRPKDAGW